MYPGIPEYFDSKGRGKYPYLTGAASWYLLTMITEVFGVKGEAGNLVIKPALLKEQFDEEGKASINLTFAEKRFDIVYTNPSKLQVGEYKIKEASLNGVKLAVENNKIIIPLKTVENHDAHEVVVVLE